MSRLYAVVALLALTASTWAGSFYVKVKHRVENGKDNGYCAWAALDTIARHRKIKPLIGVSDPFKETGNGATVQDVQRHCKKLGISCRIWEPYNKNLTELKRACDKKLGAIASFKVYHKGKVYSHAVLVTGYDKRYVYYIDSNEPDTYYRANWSWWHRRWTGWMVIID